MRELLPFSRTRIDEVATRTSWVLVEGGKEGKRTTPPVQRGVNLSTVGHPELKGLLEEAAEAGKPVRIHVETNPAMRLYQRLGFVGIEDQGVYFLMEWSPNVRAKTGEH